MVASSRVASGSVPAEVEGHDHGDREQDRDRPGFFVRVRPLVDRPKGGDGDDEQAGRDEAVEQPEVDAAQALAEVADADGQGRTFHLINVPVGARPGIGREADHRVHLEMYAASRIGRDRPSCDRPTWGPEADGGRPETSAS